MLLPLSLPVEKLKSLLSKFEFDGIVFSIESINSLVAKVNKNLQDAKVAGDDVLNKSHKDVDAIYSACKELTTKIQQLLHDKSWPETTDALLLCEVGYGINQLLDSIKKEFSTRDEKDVVDNADDSNEENQSDENEDNPSDFLERIAAALIGGANTCISDVFIEAYLDWATKEESCEDFKAEQGGKLYLDCIALLNTIPVPLSWEKNRLEVLFYNLTNLLDTNDSESPIHLFNSLRVLQYAKVLDFEAIENLIDSFKAVKSKNNNMIIRHILMAAANDVVRVKVSESISRHLVKPQGVNHPNQEPMERTRRLNDRQQGLGQSKRGRADEPVFRPPYPVWFPMRVYYPPAAQGFLAGNEGLAPPAAPENLPKVDVAPNATLPTNKR